MKGETHEGIILRFFSAIGVYLLGIIFIFLLTYGLLRLGCFIRENLNITIFGTPFTNESKQHLMDFLYAFTNFSIIGLSIIIVLVAAKILNLLPFSMYKGLKPIKFGRYSVIYGFVGALFGLIAAVIMRRFYFIISFFHTVTELVRIDNVSISYWDVIFSSSGALFALFTIIMFILSGLRYGLKYDYRK